MEKICLVNVQKRRRDLENECEFRLGSGGGRGLLYEDWGRRGRGGVGSGGSAICRSL